MERQTTVADFQELFFDGENGRVASSADFAPESPYEQEGVEVAA